MVKNLKNVVKNGGNSKENIKVNMWILYCTISRMELLILRNHEHKSAMRNKYRV